MYRKHDADEGVTYTEGVKVVASPPVLPRIPADAGVDRVQFDVARTLKPLVLISNVDASETAVPEMT